MCVCVCKDKERDEEDDERETRRSHEPIAKDTSGSCNKESMGGPCSILGQCHPLELESSGETSP